MVFTLPLGERMLSERTLSATRLNFARLKRSSFSRFGAVRTPEAADEENRNPHRDQHGEDTSVRGKPVNQMLHIECPHSQLQNSVADLVQRQIILNVGAPVSRCHTVYHRQVTIGVHLFIAVFFLP